MCVVQDELKSLMAIADVDGDGLIDYNEFVAATMHVSKLEKEELLQKVGVRALPHAAGARCAPGSLGAPGLVAFKERSTLTAQPGRARGLRVPWCLEHLGPVYALARRKASGCQHWH